MQRLVFSAVCAAALFAGTGPTATAQNKWATVKGQVVFPGDKELPKRAPLNVTQDKDHCLSKGEILDESVIVSAKNKGIKNVVVFLRPDDTDLKAELPKEAIHPDDKNRKAGEVVIDQPCCMFGPRVTVARAGDKLTVKNSAPVAHNLFWETSNNGSYNVTIPKMDKWELKEGLAKEEGNRPIQYKCTIHGWMTGYVRVFDHPYYAITDDSGNFEIKNAPVGKYRIVYWHENGVRGGAKGRAGDPIEIAGPTLEIKPVEFDVSPK